jgi:molybdopterin synthase sulfur carrier subunit
VIKVVYFARLREDLGSAGESLALPEGVATVGALRTHLADRGGPWATALAANRAVRVAVNHDMAQASTPLQPGDEVAFFPPVTGG